MTPADTPGQIVILNGTPRAGKSSIATAIQETFDGLWMNLGVAPPATWPTAPKIPSPTRSAAGNAKSISPAFTTSKSTPRS